MLTEFSFFRSLPRGRRCRSGENCGNVGKRTVMARKEGLRLSGFMPPMHFVFRKPQPLRPQVYSGQMSRSERKERLPNSRTSQFRLIEPVILIRYNRKCKSFQGLSIIFEKLTIQSYFAMLLSYYAALIHFHCTIVCRVE